MGNGCIGVIAAMPEEIAPLLRRVREYRKEKADGFNVYRFTSAGSPVVLVESGMGPGHAAAATKALIALAAPQLIINFGFGGAVLPGLEVGDVVVAERVLLLANGRVQQEGLPDERLGHLLVERCGSAGTRIKRGTFITSQSILNKKKVAGSVDELGAHPVLEMETAAILATAQDAGVPVVAVRAISDAADEELGFSLEEFCDAELNVRLAKVLRCVARRPWIIPQLLRLAANTKRAGKMLAPCVTLSIEALREAG